MFVLFMYKLMTILATCSKSSKGFTTTWRFCEVAGAYFALRDNNKVIPCKDKADLINLYNRMVMTDKYGFTPCLA